MICEPGYWCKDGIRDVCDKGHYGNEKGLHHSSCSGPCHEGFYCLEGNTNPRQFPCGNKSLYCPRGSWQPIEVSLGYYTIGGGECSNQIYKTQSDCESAPAYAGGPYRWIPGPSGGPKTEIMGSLNTNSNYSNGILSTDQAIVVSSINNFGDVIALQGEFLKIRKEIVQVIGVSGETINVIRGALGSVASNHPGGTDITLHSGGPWSQGQFAEVICPEGWYCPSQLGTKHICQPGLYGKSLGLTTSECSGSVHPGYYCPPPGGCTTPNEVECGGAHLYCPSYGLSAPVAVTDGYYTIRDDSYVDEEFFVLDIKEGLNNNGLSASLTTRTAQRQCEPGFYCQYGRKFSCPKGYWGDTQGQTNELCDGLCAPGFWCPQASINATVFECGNSTVWCPEGSSWPLPVDEGFYTVVERKVPIPRAIMNAGGSGEVVGPGRTPGLHGLPFINEFPWPTSSGCDRNHPDTTIGNNDCCSIDNLCGVGEGNCKSDDECLPGLRCGTSLRAALGDWPNYKGNCAWGDNDHCCYHETSLDNIWSWASTNSYPLVNNTVIGMRVRSSLVDCHKNTVTCEHYPTISDGIGREKDPRHSMGIQMGLPRGNADGSPGDLTNPLGTFGRKYLLIADSKPSKGWVIGDSWYNLLTENECRNYADTLASMPGVEGIAQKVGFDDYGVIVSDKMAAGCLVMPGFWVKYNTITTYAPPCTYDAQCVCDRGNKEFPHDTTFRASQYYFPYETHVDGENVRDNQKPCEPGYFCVDGKRYECAPGFWGSESRATGERVNFGDVPSSGRQCKGKCERGYYCPSSSTSSRQSECGDLAKKLGVDPARYYCPIGSTSPVPVDLGFYTIRHPTASPPNPLFAIAPIDIAAQNFYFANVTTRDSQVLCEAGKYCVGGTKHPCPPGRYGEKTGMSNPYCSGLCSPGYFCPTNSTKPTQRECSSSNFYDSSERFNIDTSMTNIGTRGHPASVYCPLGSELPTTVNIGYYSIGGTHTNTTKISQKQCDPGWFCVNGVRHMCPAGTWDNARGRSSNGNVIRPRKVRQTLCTAPSGNLLPASSQAECERTFYSWDYNAATGVQCKDSKHNIIPGSFSLSPFACEKTGNTWTWKSSLQDIQTELNLVNRNCKTSYAGNVKDPRCPNGVLGVSTGKVNTLSDVCNGPCDAGYYCYAGSLSPRQFRCGHVGVFCPSGSSAPQPVSAGHYTVNDGCNNTEFGCCADGISSRDSTSDENCPIYSALPLSSCRGSMYGCCMDGSTSRSDTNGSNCNSHVSTADYEFCNDACASVILNGYSKTCTSAGACVYAHSDPCQSLSLNGSEQHCVWAGSNVWRKPPEFPNAVPGYCVDRHGRPLDDIIEEVDCISTDPPQCVYTPADPMTGTLEKCEMKDPSQRVNESCVQKTPFDCSSVVFDRTPTLTFADEVKRHTLNEKACLLGGGGTCTQLIDTDGNNILDVTGDTTEASCLSSGNCNNGTDDVGTCSDGTPNLSKIQCETGYCSDGTGILSKALCEARGICSDQAFETSAACVSGCYKTYTNSGTGSVAMEIVAGITLKENCNTRLDGSQEWIERLWTPRVWSPRTWVSLNNKQAECLAEGACSDNQSVQDGTIDNVEYLIGARCTNGPWDRNLDPLSPLQGDSTTQISCEGPGATGNVWSPTNEPGFRCSMANNVWHQIETGVDSFQQAELEWVRDGAPWEFCANEFGNCECPGGLVRFGIEGQWAKDADGNTRMIISSSANHSAHTDPLECSHEIFGADPAPGMAKHCQCRREPTELECTGVTGNTWTEGGDTTTAILSEYSSSKDVVHNFYNGKVIRFIRGPGQGQSATITSYDGTTKVATFAPITTPVKKGTKYTLSYAPYSGMLVSGTTTTATLAQTASSLDNYYNGKVLWFSHGTGIGQRIKILDYVGKTRLAKFTIAGNARQSLTVAGDSTTVYVIQMNSDIYNTEEECLLANASNTWMSYNIWTPTTTWTPTTGDYDSNLQCVYIPRNSTKTAEKECEKGFFCIAGVKHKCPAGTFGNKRGLTGTNDHGFNRVGATAYGANSICSGWCPAGHFCPPGTIDPFQPEHTCLPGTYSNQGAVECTACPWPPTLSHTERAKLIKRQQCVNSRQCCHMQ